MVGLTLVAALRCSSLAPTVVRRRRCLGRLRAKVLSEGECNFFYHGARRSQPLPILAAASERTAFPIVSISANHDLVSSATEATFRMILRFLS
jgi:hypothetical protein